MGHRKAFLDLSIFSRVDLGRISIDYGWSLIRSFLLQGGGDLGVNHIHLYYCRVETRISTALNPES